MKNCVIYKTVLDEQFFVQYLLQTQHQFLYLCRTYFIVPYEMHTGPFLIQIKKVKQKYFQHNN